MAYSFIGQYFFTVHADYNVAVVAPHYLPEATQTALQDALAAYGAQLDSTLSSSAMSKLPAAKIVNANSANS